MISKKVGAISLILILTLSAIMALPTAADDPATELKIGSFKRLVGSDDLTEGDLEVFPERIVLRAPNFASELRVDLDYLNEKLAAWSSDRAFTVKNGQAVFQGEDITFRPFHPSADPAFTLGSRANLYFEDRPMWVSIAPDGDGFRLEMDDGRTDGQRVFVAKEWLHSLGIHRPTVRHQDGYQVDVSRSEGGYWLDVPHFSFVILLPSLIDVRGENDDGDILTHIGQVRWDSSAKVLEVDVGLKSSNYTVLIEKDWFDANLKVHGSDTHRFFWAPAGNPTDVRIPLTPQQTPTTIRFVQFKAGTDPMWSYGKPGEVVTAAFNDTIQHLAGAAKFSYRGAVGSVNISAPDTGARPDLLVSTSYLESFGITWPYVTPNSLNYTADSELNHTWTGFAVYGVDTSATVLGNGTFIRRAVPETSMTIHLNATWNLTTESPAYRPWIQLNTTVFVGGIAWNQTIPGSTAVVAGVGLLQGNNRIGFVNLTAVSEPGTNLTLNYTQFSVPGLDVNNALTLEFFGSEHPPSSTDNSILTLPVLNPVTEDAYEGGVVDTTEFTQKVHEALDKAKCTVRVNRDFPDTQAWLNPDWAATPAMNSYSSTWGSFTYENSCADSSDPSAHPPTNFEWWFGQGSHSATWLQAPGIHKVDFIPFHKSNEMTKTGGQYHRLTNTYTWAFTAEFTDPDDTEPLFSSVGKDIFRRWKQCTYEGEGVGPLVMAIKGTLELVGGRWSPLSNLIPPQECVRTVTEMTWEYDGKVHYGAGIVADPEMGWVFSPHYWNWGLGGQSHSGGLAYTDHVNFVRNSELYRACETKADYPCAQISTTKDYGIRVGADAVPFYYENV